MKRFLITLALAMTAAFADAQGTIQFPRLRIEYCLVPMGGVPAPGELSFGLFVGPTANNLSAQPLLPLGTNTAAGFVGVPNQAVYQIPGFEPNSTLFMQVRGWETRFGLDWEHSSREGMYGQTAIISAVLGPSVGPGTVIVGPNAEIVMCVPEPSTITLAFLGLMGLLVLGRRRMV
jgi:uncharacterized protein (TIGR03382 family)